MFVSQLKVGKQKSGWNGILYNLAYLPFYLSWGGPWLCSPFPPGLHLTPKILTFFQQEEAQKWVQRGVCLPDAESTAGFHSLPTFFCHLLRSPSHPINIPDIMGRIISPRQPTIHWLRTVMVSWERCIEPSPLVELSFSSLRTTHDPVPCLGGPHLPLSSSEFPL